MAKVLTLLAAILFAASGAAVAAPRPALPAGSAIIAVQFDCVGPHCLSANPLRPPGMQLHRPLDYPAGSVFRRQPVRPKVRPPAPQIDTSVPIYGRNKPLVHSPLPKNTTYPAAGVTRQHVQWCVQNYRSYRPRDNTFQPFSGQRKQCQSPFM